MPPRKNPYAKPDHFTRAAKKEGFPARSVFKLEEIDRRVRLLRGRMRVLDLGAAPGSWAMYAAGRIGPEGRVLAVDLGAAPDDAAGECCLPRGRRLVSHERGPRPVCSVRCRAQRHGPANDGEPRYRSGPKLRAFHACFGVAGSLGAPGSSFVGKIFMSDDLPAARAELQTPLRLRAAHPARRARGPAAWKSSSSRSAKRP